MTREIFGLIGFEESMVGAAVADLELDAFVALRTAAFIGCAFFVDVDANVDVTTVEFDADEFARHGSLGSFSGRYRRR